MQRRFLPQLTMRAAAFGCAMLLSAAACAAQLGDISVRSYIGQQLAADIELVALAPEEMNGLPVHLAPADVYRGPNVTMDKALARPRLSVAQRDQRAFLY